MLSTVVLLSSFILQAIIIANTKPIIHGTPKILANDYELANLLFLNNIDSGSDSGVRIVDYEPLRKIEEYKPVYEFVQIPEVEIVPHDIKKRSSDDTFKQQDAAATSEMFSNREARGATREQWIKQPYPVDFQSKKNNDDQISSNSKMGNENPSERGPRVHFVTNQKRFDASESRSQLGDGQRTSSSSPPSPRTTRMYETNQAAVPAETSPAGATDTYNEYRNRRRSSYPRDYNRYDLDSAKNPTTRYDEYDMTMNYNGKNPTQKKQQRIIYYATLPEVVRTPPNVDLRYRSPHEPPPPPHMFNYYNGRGPYDPKKVTSPPISTAEYGFDPYDHYRQGRYDVPSTYISPRLPYYRKPYLPRYPVLDYGIDHPRAHAHAGDGVYYDIRPGARPEYPRRAPYISKEPHPPRMPPHVSKDAAVSPPHSINERAEEAISNFPVYSPVKISTSVNVKEIENNEPERRVYSKQERDHSMYKNHHFGG